MDKRIMALPLRDVGANWTYRVQGRKIFRPCTQSIPNRPYTRTLPVRLPRNHVPYHEPAGNRK